MLLAVSPEALVRVLVKSLTPIHGSGKCSSESGPREMAHDLPREVAWNRPRMEPSAQFPGGAGRSDVDAMLKMTVLILEAERGAEPVATL